MARSDEISEHLLHEYVGPAACVELLARLHREAQDD